MFDHCIHIQSLDLTLKSTTDANLLEDQVKHFFNKELLKDIEQAFDEICPPDIYLQIDKIELDLGQLNINQLKKIGKAVFLQKLKKSLLQYTTSPVSNQTNISFSESNSRKTFKKQSIQIYKEDIFFFFLKNGHYPTSFNSNKKIALKDLLQDIIKKPSSSFFHELRHLFQNNEYASIRFFNTVNSEQQINILSKLSINQSAIDFVIQFQKAIEVLISNYEKSPVSIKESKKLHFQSKSKSKILYSILSHKNDKPIPDSFDLSAKTLNELVDLIAELLDSTKDDFSSFMLQQETTIEDLKSNPILESISKHLKKNNSSQEFSSPKQQKQEDIFSKPKVIQKDISPLPQKTSISKHKKRKTEAIDTEGIYINNAGLILLHPYLSIYFKTLDLLDSEGSFKNDLSAERAVQLLHFLVFGHTAYQENELVLNKILCGLPLEFPVHPNFELSEFEVKESDILLKTVIKYWEAIKNTSIDGLRTSFLQRDGKINLTRDDFITLKIEQKTIDILLDKLSWNISILKLPWMSRALSTQWN